MSKASATSLRQPSAHGPVPAAPTWHANVTPTVAAHLQHFGVPSSRYNVLDIGGPSLSVLKSRLSQHLVTMPQTGPVKKGDIVIADASSIAYREAPTAKHGKHRVVDGRRLVRVEEVMEGIQFVGRLIMPACDVWGRAAAATELYQTNNLVSCSSVAILGLIDPASCRLLFAHDGTECAWYRLDSHIRPNKLAGFAPRLRESTLIIEGVEYHESDCILLRMKGTNSALLEIAQLHKIEKAASGVVRLLLVPLLRMGYQDPHRLVLASAHEAFEFDQSRWTIVRKCIVTKRLASESDVGTLQEDLVFWTSSPDFSSCGECELKQREKEVATEKVMRRSLRTFDLFAGAGGLSLGLALAGNIKTKWAVEKDERSARTLQKSHPHAAVFTADASDLLSRWCTEVSSGSESGSGMTLPKKGEVDLLVAGPPCQSFSHLNPSRDPTDGRSMLIAVTLSWVEALGPDYVVIENVGGIMDNINLNDVNQGFPKLIVLSLLSLGYSVQIANVEAAAYGVPQERRRMIFLAAKEGLPRLPPPSHVIAPSRISLSRSIKLWPGDGAAPREYPTVGQELEGCAPLSAVTVMEAIDDLPAFDWLDPHVTYPLRSSTLSRLDQEKAARAARGIPALEATRAKGESAPVGARLQRYGTEPRTLYQVMMRQDCQGSSVVSQHQTARYNVSDVERVTNLLLRPMANHRSWSSPQVNKPLLIPEWLCSPEAWSRDETESLRKGKSRIREGQERSTDGVYQRLDSLKPFHTSITNSSPSNRHCAVVHPTQMRTLTLRESARVQGFPDWVTWDCSIEEAHRQIGNAVPVPLARMLGKAIIENVEAVEARKRDMRERIRAKARRGKKKARDD